MELFNLPKTMQDIGTGHVEMVNTRDLYKFLEVEQDFYDWVKFQVSDFRENVDYVSYISDNEVEYYVTEGTATRIAMMEDNDVGYSVRQYFIDREKLLRATAPKTLYEALVQAACAEKARMDATNNPN